MPTGLPVSRLIRTTVSLAPLAAQFANLSSLLIMGDSDVIDVHTRIRAYGSIDEVAAEFGTSAPEYLAAVPYFGQRPRPTNVLIGKWAQAAVAGRLLGAVLSKTQQAISNFSSIASGGFSVTVDGGSIQHLTGIVLTGVGNLNAVATAVNEVLTGAICSWNAIQNRFEIHSSTTGAASKVSPATIPSSGTDISTLLGLTVAAGASEVDGMAPETALAAVALMDDLAMPWYGLTIASTNIVDADHEAIAAYIEAADANHIYGVSSQDPAIIDPTQDTDIASVLSAAGYTRTFVQYSSSSPYAASSIFGRFLTTNFNQNNSVITLMYKQEPGITPETLTTTAADTLEAKRCNVLVNYNNGTAIIQDGVMAGPAFIDEIYGLDWFANAIQTNAFNALYTATTKVPQTDDGNHIIATAIEVAGAQGVTNGLLAPGTWNSEGFGQLKPGDLLSKGYYVYQPPVSAQAQADREARKSVAFQVAGKLAGAVHTADIGITVNR